MASNGPLTTIFVPPGGCIDTPIVGHCGAGCIWLLGRYQCGTTGGVYLEYALTGDPTCYPSGKSDGYFSPGTACPSGYATVASGTSGKETRATCCPSGLAVRGSYCENLNDAVYQKTAVCNASNQPASISSAAITFSSTDNDVNFVRGFSVEVRWQASDLVTSTSTPRIVTTAQPQPAPTPTVAPQSTTVTTTARAETPTGTARESTSPTTDNTDVSIVHSTSPSTLSSLYSTTHAQTTSGRLALSVSGASSGNSAAGGGAVTGTTSFPAEPSGATTSGLSTGAKAAIGVVVPVVVLSLLISLFFFLPHRRKVKSEASESDHQPSAYADHAGDGIIPAATEPRDIPPPPGMVELKADVAHNVLLINAPADHELNVAGVASRHHTYSPEPVNPHAHELETTQRFEAGGLPRPAEFMGDTTHPYELSPETRVSGMYPHPGTHTSSRPTSEPFVSPSTTARSETSGDTARIERLRVEKTKLQSERRDLETLMKLREQEARLVEEIARLENS